jgi:thioredoxin 1
MSRKEERMNSFQDDNAAKRSLVENPYSIVMFTASWCGPCKSFKPKFQKLADANPGISFALCDVEEVTALSGKMQIQSVPTIIAFEGGEELDRVIGANEDAVKALVTSLKNQRVKKENS